MRRVSQFLIFLNLISLFCHAQWTNLNANLPGNLRGVSFSNVSTGIVGGSAGLFFTSNGGISWQRVNPTGIPADTMLYHYTSFKSILYATSTSTWIAVGKDTVQNEAVIFRINSTATSCIKVYAGSGGADLNDIKQVMAYEITVGKSGLALVSGDGGLTWGPLQNFSSNIDLYSITSSGSSVYIVGNGVAYKTGSFPNFGWTTYSGTPIMNKIAYGSAICGVGAGAYYSANSGLSWPTITNYNSYPINGRSIVFRASGDGSIATDHGVYRSISGIYIWEFQPSSFGYNLNDLFFFSGGTGYAVGNNGLVIKTTNSGDPSLPYVNYTSHYGACLDSTIQFSNLSPSVAGYSYKWKNNAVQFATSYNTSYTFSSLGNFNIRLVGTHNAVSDSVTYTMPIVNLPDLSKTYSVSDTLLCKSGSSTITVHNSDPGVIYKLYRWSPWTLIDQINGNGTDVDLHTGTITDSTYYRVKAVSMLADCGGYLPDTILIGVEKTKAAFHCQLINAEIGEPVNFIENCSQAAYFNWSFGSNANPVSSTNANPSGITYNSFGQTQVTLIATSLYGCVDTVTANAVNIFDNSGPALNTSCWAITLDGTNPGFTYEEEAGYDLSADNNGNLLVGGRFTHAIFTSRAGISPMHTTNCGLFLADYNSNGVLKWLVHGGEATTLSRIADVERCADGSIYATGFGSAAWIHTNRGDSLYIGTGSYVFHFDSLGGLIWYCRFPNLSQNELPMKVDTAGNCYITGNGSPTSFYSSVSGTQTITGLNARFFFAKINANGTLGWITKAINSSAYYTSSNDLAIDKSGNIFITGNYSAALTFYSVSSTSIIAPAAGQGCDIFLAKYTSAGNVVWVKHAGTPASNYTFDYGFCVTADDSGNTYVSGQVESYYPGMTVEFPGPNNSIIQSPIGQLFYAAFDTAGNFRWSGGTQFAVDGRSTVVTLGKHQKILGSGWLYTPTSEITNFISNNNSYTSLPVNNGSFYFTSYDTSGILDFVNTETGITPSGQAVDAEAWGMDDDSAGNIYVAGDIWTFNGNPNYTIADTTLVLNGQDAFIAKLGNGCIVPNTFTPLITSINQENTEPLIQIFPNPSAGLIHLNASSEINRIIITDVLGRVIQDYFPEQKNNELHINESGIYFVSVFIKGKQLKRKIIVEN